MRPAVASCMGCLVGIEGITGRSSPRRQMPSNRVLILSGCPDCGPERRQRASPRRGGRWERPLEPRAFLTWAMPASRDERATQGFGHPAGADPSGGKGAARVEHDSRVGVLAEDHHAWICSELISRVKSLDESRLVMAAPTSPANKGCGLVGRERSSGCAWVPM